MKYILSFVGIVIIFCGIFLFGQKDVSANAINDDYMRIHITANSNSSFDQNLKYNVKDAVVEFLIPKLAYAENKEEASKIIAVNIFEIQNVVNQTLNNEGANYLSTISIAQEEIPTRVYDDLVLEEGIYDCLKIDLGNAKGDNWWCVVFPAVCFISSKNYENYVYISKIWEIINSVIR